MCVFFLFAHLSFSVSSPFPSPHLFLFWLLIPSFPLLSSAIEIPSSPEALRLS